MYEPRRGFHLEITSLDELQAFVAIIRGENLDDPKLQARIDALTTKQAEANAKLAADVAAHTPQP